MASTITTDSIREVSCREVAGIMVEAVTTAILEETTADAWPANKSKMQNVLDEAGLPAPGDTFDADHPNLWLDHRDVRFESPKRCEVVSHFTYYPSLINGDAALDKLSSQMTQITSQTDRSAMPIIVEHSNRKQNGEISVLSPQDGFTRDVVFTVLPGAQYVVKDQWQGKINSSPWNGGDAKTWLCTAATPDPLAIKVGAAFWHFIYHFEFAYDPEGWQPEVFWRDASTGRPPDGLVQDVGRKTVIWYDTLNFNDEPTQPIFHPNT